MPRTTKVTVALAWRFQRVCDIISALGFLKWLLLVPGIKSLWDLQGNLDPGFVDSLGHNRLCKVKHTQGPGLSAMSMWKDWAGL